MNQEAIQAVRKLAHMGYRFTVNRETIKGKYEGQGDPDPGQVRPLLDVVKAHKSEVVDFLNRSCPNCGGVVFGTFNEVCQCMACYWEKQARLYPHIAAVKH